MAKIVTSGRRWIEQRPGDPTVVVDRPDEMDITAEATEYALHVDLRTFLTDISTLRDDPKQLPAVRKMAAVVVPLVQLIVRDLADGRK